MDQLRQYGWTAPVAGAFVLVCTWSLLRSLTVTALAWALIVAMRRAVR